jgi:putative ABC transport system permease protein
MGVLWDKVWRDLWENKARTLQVTLIIAVGTFAIGMIIGTHQFMITGMQTVWRRSAPPTIYLSSEPGIDDATLAVLSNVDGVTAVEGLAQKTVEWRLSPEDLWQPAELSARDNYEQQVLSINGLVSGVWPHKKQIAVGQGGDTAFQLHEGDRVYIRVDKHVTAFIISGVIYDPIGYPPSVGGNVQFYTTREQFGYLIGNENYTRIFAATERFDQAQAASIAAELQIKLEKQGVLVGGALPRGDKIANPAEHFFQANLNGMFFILGFMAAFILLLSLFLVYNTITALVNRQINQIGILKAIGAQAPAIFFVYLAIVLTCGLMAILIAIPLSALAARALGAFLMAAFNAKGEFALSALSVQAQGVIALLTPLAASLGPLWTSGRIPVHEAISSYGLRADATLLDRMLAKVRFLPALLALTVSSTFRHKQRVILTEISLTLSGLTFMAVMTTQETTTYTYGDLLSSILRFDVNLATERPERISRMEEIARRLPEVKTVEAWHQENGNLHLAGRSKSSNDKLIAVFGVPLPTELYRPRMVAGRWLHPGDGNVVVLSQELAEEAGVGIGDLVTLQIGVGHKSSWEVVGLLFDPLIALSAHAPRDALARAQHKLNRANAIWVQAYNDDNANMLELAQHLRNVYSEERMGLRVVSVFGYDTSLELFELCKAQVNVVLTLLVTMAVLSSVVGSLALSGVLSLNVLERRREIGLLRAAGARSSAIFVQFIGESLILSWLSWLIALPLSIPAGRLMVDGLSKAMDIELIYHYTPAGPLIWLGTVTILAVAASGLPARHASRISVRESLAYE